MTATLHYSAAWPQQAFPWRATALFQHSTRFRGVETAGEHWTSGVCFPVRL